MAMPSVTVMVVNSRGVPPSEATPFFTTCACRDNFLVALKQRGMSARDIHANINFFMNVPVTAAGGLSFEDGVSAGGRYVEMSAGMDLICLISNCPQLNNPCNAYNPTPVRLLIWD